MVDEPTHPKAHHVKVLSCGDPECGQPHLVLFDEFNNVIAEAVLSDMAVGLIAEFEPAAFPVN
jgi:hypothetical protein